MNEVKKEESKPKTAQSHSRMVEISVEHQASGAEEVNPTVLREATVINVQGDPTDGGRNEAMPYTVSDTDALLGNKGKGRCCCCSKSEESSEQDHDECERCCEKFLSIMYEVLKAIALLIVFIILLSLSPIAIVLTILFCSRYLAVQNYIHLYKACSENDDDHNNDRNLADKWSQCYDKIKQLFKTYTSLCDGCCSEGLACVVWIFAIVFTIIIFFAAIVIFLVVLFSVCCLWICEHPKTTTEVYHRGRLIATY